MSKLSTFALHVRERALSLKEFNEDISEAKLIASEIERKINEKIDSILV